MMLLSAIAKPYYRKNIAFYLLVFLLAFGVLKSQEHVALAKQIMANPLLLGILLFIYALHVLKTSIFVHTILKEETHLFLRYFELLPLSRKLLELSKLQIALHAPFLLYSLFQFQAGITQKNHFSLVLLMLGILLLCILPLAWMIPRFSAISEYQDKGRTSTWSIPFPKDWKLWFLRYLFQKEAVFFLSTKLFSCLLIIGACFLYVTDAYDQRLIFLAVFFAGIGHFMLGYHYKIFLCHEISFLRNSPIQISAHFQSMLLTALGFLILEAIFLLRYLPGGLSFWNAVEAFILLVSSLSFWLSFAFWPKAFSEKYNKRLFLAGACILVIIMASVPPILLSSLLLLLAFWRLKVNYSFLEWDLEE